MWPWEHLAVGYLAYSLLVRLVRGHPPRGRLTIAALALGTQFPDLVDKPLAWFFHVLPSGTSLAHSVFVAVPLVTLLVGVTWWLGRPSVGAAFGTGYLLHLPADVLYVLFYGSDLNWRVLMWPLYTSNSQQFGFFGNIVYYFGNYTSLVTSETAAAIVVFELVLVGGALLLWVLDGVPGVRSHEPSRRRRPSQN
jgi:hypothetical protein